MLFNDFDKDEKCSTCGKRLIDLAEGRVSCKPCDDEVELATARTSVLGHLAKAAYCLFSFDFIGMLAELIWAIQRLTGKGDYGENGQFTRLLEKHGPK